MAFSISERQAIEIIHSYLRFKRLNNKRRDDRNDRGKTIRYNLKDECIFAEDNVKSDDSRRPLQRKI
jgi:hypothetical protein